MRKLLTGIVAFGVIGLLPALAMADHERSRSRSRTHVSIGINAGVHYQTGSTYSRRHYVTHVQAPPRVVVQHRVIAPPRVIVQQQRVHYLPAYSPQVVVVQPCPAPVVYQPAPVYYYPQPQGAYYYQHQTYYYGR